MSKLVDSSISIYEALENIKTGKYVMPAFQCHGSIPIKSYRFL
jgi:hypothetical protein